ncbi:MAG: hypothetical protein Greene071436_213, partial [Parcubacteria group bacterium Greene0714_36]
KGTLMGADAPAATEGYRAAASAKIPKNPRICVKNPFMI